ncbi:hypothetical protein V2J09_005197 [Rumex salicifolius]
METANHQLPLDGEGKCMVCGNKPSETETLSCKTCVTPWHVNCLAVRPESLASTLQWECPDCDVSSVPAAVSSGMAAPKSVTGAGDGSLVAAIKAIEADATISEQEKARKRQDLLSGKQSGSGDDSRQNGKDENDILSILGKNIECSFCMLLPDRPVTTPCGHNFCLKCFEKWVKQGKKTCAKCRETIPAKMISQPRINASLVFAIRMARTPSAGHVDAPRVIHFVDDSERPDKAFTTDRAKKSGNANAKSGRIFVTIPNDHLGPILAENDPVKKTGVLVGDSWTDRLACRQWGAHFPHVSGIAGQSGYGAQSVVLSGGYEDDEDHGEWFLYTGSGGRDLSGNKRTNKNQSSDQKFTNANEALRLSCRKGYPVRVVRSHKEKRSNYAPEEGVRYDGVYRIEKCWRSNGNQGYKVCRYLFVRCDNSPAPWTGDEHGDRPRPLPLVPELKRAIDITERKESPYWDFDESDGCWKWKKPQPATMIYKKGNGGKGIRKSSAISNKEKILKEFSCLLCRKVMTLPMTTPCAHNFCKSCLDGAFAGQTYVRERSRGGRQLRTQKNVMKCPTCTTDISEYLQNAQVNRELMGAIESIQRKFEDEKDPAESDEDAPGTDEEDAASEESEILNSGEIVTEEPTLKMQADEEAVENGEKIAELSQKVVEADEADVEPSVDEEPTLKRQKVEMDAAAVENVGKIAELSQNVGDADPKETEPVEMDVDDSSEGKHNAAKCPSSPAPNKKRGTPGRNPALSFGHQEYEKSADLC